MSRTPSVKRALAEYSWVVLTGGTSKRRKRAEQKLKHACRKNLARAYALKKDVDDRSVSQRRVPLHRQRFSYGPGTTTRRLPPAMLTVYA